jgi:pimeloyl-ACP methyl ester carboxylesterase
MELFIKSFFVIILMEEGYIKVSEKPLIQLRHRYFSATDKENSKRTIIMIIGFLDNIDNRMPLVDAFRKIANIIIYDPRGYGKSSAPHKRRIYGVKAFTEDFVKIVKYYDLENEKFFIWGSCVGSAIAFQYYLNNIDPKPYAIIAASPDAKFKTQWWFEIVNLFPFPLVWVTYKFVMFVLKRYLKRKNPSDVKNVDYSIERFSQTDLYVQMRILVELVHRFDIRGREEEVDLPILVITPEKDWFVDPANSERFSKINPKSKWIKLGDAHRLIVDTEETIANYIDEFINSLK